MYSFSLPPTIIKSTDVTLVSMEPMSASKKDAASMLSKVLKIVEDKNGCIYKDVQRMLKRRILAGV